MYKKNKRGGNVRKTGKKKINQKLLLIISLVLVIILITNVILFKLKSNRKEDNLVYEKFDAIGGKIDDNQYYIFGLIQDIYHKLE